MDNQTKARFFGMHIGGEVLWGRKDEDIRRRGRLTGASARSVFVLGDMGIIDLCIQDDDYEYKLILRPLSSITDEEVFEAFNTAGVYGIEVVRDSDKIGVIGQNGVSAVIWIKTSPKPVGRFLEAWNNFPRKSQPECFEYMLVDYLRSRNFCLPFMGIDPVEAGWAVLSE